jgi:hypothetical protein
MVKKQLEQLQLEVAHVKAKKVAAAENWKSATDPQTTADLMKVYDYTHEKEERLHNRLAALEARLLGAGERTTLLPCQQHLALSLTGSAVLTYSIMPARGQAHASTACINR